MTGSAPRSKEDFDDEMALSETLVGSRIRHARISRGLTLQQLAALVDCSTSLLSKVENRKANPSIPMLHKICRALGTNIALLFASAEDRDTVVLRANERPVLATDQMHNGIGITLERLIPALPGNLLQGHIHIVQPGGYNDGTLEHEGEEVGYVLEGTLEIVVNGKKYLVEAGDSFFFHSDLPHSYRNPGDCVTRIVWINTPPTF
ncbi:cupin domain-containing protein [Pusillimonas sp. CC-YST705]|uniref:Cupin domain-containing protein n=1 Tax=Mesopusillimonas faecipullorum TaxID=2755040 RepID=A0ABS8C8P8_9BURK|nr:cupin domain-containing protein [Mesopusillimonas faecipullorum]MCB5362405.1 cupin domain-containing protein [Mesopusillimonas faecipullorum]